jgi:hypothetical protein
VRQTCGGCTGSRTTGKQINVACIADLRDGHMVWCATKSDDSNDLAENDRARVVLAELLRGPFECRSANNPDGRKAGRGPERTAGT